MYTFRYIYAIQYFANTVPTLDSSSDFRELSL
jgi:hypothetical protein